MSFSPHHTWATLPPEEIEIKTLRALRNHVSFLKESSPYYREKLASVSPKEITTLQEFAALVPQTKKTDFSKDTEAFYVADEQHRVETVVTSGSTGTPLVVPLTTSDLERLSYNEALSFYNAGVRKNDRAQILVSLDRLFIAGMAYYRGLTTLGVNTSRIGVLNTAMQQEYFELLKPTLLVGVPSFLLKFGKALQQAGIEVSKSAVKKIFCIGEPIRREDFEYNAVAQELQELFGATVFSTYASTETASTFCDCETGGGAHLHPELLYAEILDEKNEPVPPGIIGELVVTPLGIEGVPLLRYRTGDMTAAIPGVCNCGRHSLRIGAIVSRKSHLFKIKGTSVYPLTITNTLDSFSSIVDYIIELTSSGGHDDVHIHAAMPAGDVGGVMQALQSAARVHIPVLVTNEATLNRLRRDSRKKSHLVDNR